MTMYPIATYTAPAGGMSGGLFFDQIPQTFSHLQLRATVRCKAAGSSGALYMDVWNVYGSIFPSARASHILRGDGASATSLSHTGLPYGYAASIVPAAGATASAYSTLIIDFLDYSSTTKNKTVRVSGGYDASGSGFVHFDSHLFLMTQSITGFFVDFDGFTDAGSRFDLYGIRTAEV